MRFSMVIFRRAHVVHGEKNQFRIFRDGNSTYRTETGFHRIIVKGVTTRHNTDTRILRVYVKYTLCIYSFIVSHVYVYKCIMFINIMCRDIIVYGRQNRRLLGLSRITREVNSALCITQHTHTQTFKLQCVKCIVNKYTILYTYR